MEVHPVKTRVMHPPQDDLFSVLDESLTDIKDGDVLVVTSKVIAIHQGRCIKDDGTLDKKEIARKEADAYLMSTTPEGWDLFVTEHAILANAGIDESNADGYLLLLPENPSDAAREIWQYCREKFNIENLGVVVSDSHSIPFHTGTMGVAIGLFGFHPLKKFIGEKDLFGRPFKFTRVDVADALAVAGTYAMGETSEQTPLCIIRNAPHMDFTDNPTIDELIIEPEGDIYYELLKPLFKEKKDDQA